MRVPWETIVKVFRNKLSRKKFNTLNEYADDFVEFLDNGNPLFPDSAQEEYLRSSIRAYFNLIKDTITKKVDSMIKQKGEITDQEIKQIVSGTVKEHYDKWQKADNIPSIPKSFNKNVIDKYRKVFDGVIREIFEKLPISKTNSNRLLKIAANLFSKFPKGIHKGGISGVVIAGSGEKDVFPSLDSLRLEGIVNDKLKLEIYLYALARLREKCPWHLEQLTI